MFKTTRKTATILLFISLIALSGCSDYINKSKSITTAKKIDLYTASLFHLHMKKVCRDNSLSFGYIGPLSSGWYNSGACSNDMDDINTWAILDYEGPGTLAAILLRINVFEKKNKDVIGSCVINGRRLFFSLGDVYAGKRFKQFHNIDEPIEKGKIAIKQLVEIIGKSDYNSETDITGQMDLCTASLFHSHLKNLCEDNSLSFEYRGPLHFKEYAGGKNETHIEDIYKWAITNAAGGSMRNDIIFEIKVFTEKNDEVLGSCTINGKRLYFGLYEPGGRKRLQNLDKMIHDPKLKLMNANITIRQFIEKLEAK